MTNSKSTKRALMSSILAMLVCVAMLIGSTFAWFTDSVTSGKNKIVAGNLDVELYQVKSAEEIRVTEETNLFKEDALWEPGYVEVVNLKVANEGTLALEYSFDITILNETTGTNINGEKFKLSDYIMFAVVDGLHTYADRGEAIAAAAGAAPISQLAAGKNGVLYPSERATEANPAAEYVTLIVFMPESVDNTANYKVGTAVPTIDLGVTLTATQTPYEDDSFNNLYDDTAGEITFNEAGEYTVDLEESPVYGNGDWGAIQASGSGVIVNITGNGIVKAQESADRYAMAVYAGSGATVNIYGGNFSQEITGTDPQYDMIYAGVGGHVNIYGGTFKSYTPKWTLNVYDTAYTAGNAGITVYGGTFYRYNPAESYTEPGNGEPVSYVAEGYTVVQDGDWYTVVKAAVGTEEELSAAITDAKDGDTVALTDDIALTEPVTIDKDITIDGLGGSVLSGSTITANADVTFKNIALSKPTNTHKNATLVYGRDGCENLVFEGCTFSDPQWEVMQVTSATFKSLTVNNCTFTAADVNGAESSYGNTADQAIRYIHVQPKIEDNVKAKITITNNVFQNCDKVIAVAGIFYVAGSEITIGGNVFEDLAIDADGKSNQFGIGWPNDEGLKAVEYWTGAERTFSING